MKRKLIFLLILAGIIGIIIGVYKYIAVKTPKEGVLKINATPTSSIFLDNRHLGRTPYEDKVQEGEYEVKLIPESVAQNASSWQGKVKVTHNLLTYINADLSESEFASAVDILWLEKLSGNNSEISVITVPDGSFVSVDGENKGISPLVMTDVKEGDHTVSFSSTGFVPRTLKVKTTAGFRLYISVRMALSQNEAEITPEETPVDATGSAEISVPESQTTPTPTGRQLKNTPTPPVSPAVSPTLTPKAEMPDPPGPFITIKDTEIGYLRVRDKPSTGTDSEEVGRVNPGEKYTILDEQSGWYQIKYDGVNTGWVSGKYATKTE